MRSHELAHRVRTGETSAVDVVMAALERARVLNTRTNALSWMDHASALARAAQVDDRVRRGEDPGPLAGVPVAIKDNLAEHGKPLTAGSRMLEGYVAGYDATVVGRLLAAGAVPVARTNMDEFAMGSSCETCAWGPVLHPDDPTRVPGGSSGGSAVAIAGGAVPVALGSDTGGSGRLPAAFCGVVGLKPTYGRVSRRGLVAHASSLDQVAPMGATVADVALLLSVLAGGDAADETTTEQPLANWSSAVNQGVEGLRIGVVDAWLSDGLDADVRLVVQSALRGLERAGAKLVSVEIGDLQRALAAYVVLSMAEAASNLARYDGLRYGSSVPHAEDPVTAARTAGFGAEVKRRILLGTFVASAGHRARWYDRAVEERERLRGDMLRALSEVDALVGPTAAGVAFERGSRIDPAAMLATDRFTIPASLAGLPAISVPCGSAHQLPVGLQVMTRPFDESTCLSVAGTVEANRA